MKRRDFIKRSTLFGLSAGILSSASLSRVAFAQSSNERIGIGVIGAGGMGTGDANSASRFGEIVAVADVDLNHGERMKAAFGGKPEVYQDYRKLLENKNVDVVIQATPDHWHTKINIDAMKAGKDVYGEKPLTLTIAEGQQLCKVVKETKRVFQAGTQQRSEARFQTAVELVRNGRIGKLKHVLVTLPYFSSKGGPFNTTNVPLNLDWDIFQGQAPLRPYMPQRVHSIFRWWYEYAGGITTDWGNHHMDIAHWGMNVETTGPSTVEARGIFPNKGQADCFNTPDRFYSLMKYPNDVSLHFFVTLSEKTDWVGNPPHEETAPGQIDWMFGKDVLEDVRDAKRNGILFIGERGKVFVNRGGLYGRPVEELAENPLPDNAWRAAPSLDHMKNFFDCVRSRETPVASAEIEHRSVTPCHLTNISIRLGGRKLIWDPQKETIVGDNEAAAMLSREQRAPYQVIS